MDFRENLIFRTSTKICQTRNLVKTVQGTLQCYVFTATMVTRTRHTIKLDVDCLLILGMTFCTFLRQWYIYIYIYASEKSVQADVTYVPTDMDKDFCAETTKRKILHIWWEMQITPDLHGNTVLHQCFSTAGPRPGTRPWQQLYRVTRGSPGICHFSFLSSFHA